MKCSVTVFMTDETIGPVEAARAVEERGLHGLYVPEHTHIPASRATPAPMGEPLPRQYYRTLDPFVALAAAAAVTSRIRLGTGICLLAQRDPIVTAKAVATLDLVSGGRMTFGVGYGWNAEEAAHHGVDFARRRAIVRDKVAAVQALWREDPAEHHGPHVAFGPSHAFPKPVQQPRPPVWLGVAAGPRNFADLVAWADGWIPIGARGLAEAMPRLHALLEDAGRDPATFAVVPFGSTPDRAKFERFAEIGITEVVANAPSGPASEVLPWLDRYAAVAEEL